MARARTRKEPADAVRPAAPATTKRAAKKAAAGIKGWKSAKDVLDRTVAVRTIFPDFNRATRCGGLPIRRMHTIHGPTHGGKTAFILGLLKSFVGSGYPGALVDAEHATPYDFAEETVGNLNQLPNFYASRPDNYEETIANVDSFLNYCVEEVRRDPKFRSILVVDSINKLTPKRELKKMLEGKVTEDSAAELSKGHHGRYRAAVNQAWLDRVTPQVARANCAFVIIAQEREGEDDPYRDTFVVKGGQSLTFDASIVARVFKASPVFVNPNEKTNDSIAGFRHKVRIWKLKVGHMEGRYTDCYFHLSNGKVTPAGLDIARDALDLGVRWGVVEKSGSWLTYRRRRWQGMNRAAVALSGNEEVLEAMLTDLAMRDDAIREGGK